jgi:hypothetical protein
MSGGSVFPDLSAYLKTVDLPAGVQFVSQTPQLIADLMANFPAGPTYKGKYAQVTDLWGAGIFGVMRCGYNGRIYYWEPTTQPQLLGQVTLIGNATVQPLTSLPIMELIGAGPPTLTTWNVTLGTDNAVPGMVKEIRSSFSSLLGTLNILGTGIGSTLSLALNTNKRFGCYDTGSALAWRQLT